MLSFGKIKPSSRKTRLIRVADIETDSEGRLLDIGYYDETGVYKIFASWLELLDYLPPNSRVWFHNGGKFDVLSAIEHLTKHKSWTASLSGGRVVKFNIDESNIHFCDSAALLLSSLDKLSKAFDVTHKKITSDNAEKYKQEMETFKLFHFEEYHQYLKNDCLSLCEILQKTRENLSQYGLNDLQLTVASTAMKIWRTKFLDNDIYIPHEKLQPYLRKGYFGGRCQYVGDGFKSDDGLYHNVKYIDVNSMYPAQMLYQPYPIGELFKIKNQRHFIQLVDHHRFIPYGMYRVSYSIPDTSVKYPPLISHRTKTGFEFSNQSSESYLTHEDLLLITELNGNYTVIDGYYTLETSDIFSEYIACFYKLKDEAKSESERLTSKILMNSLYGKLAQELERKSHKNICYNDDIHIDKLLKKYKCTDLTELEDLINLVPINETVDSVIYEQLEPVLITQCTVNPLIAAYVTARARRALWREMEKHDTIYVDTDSLITQSEIKAEISREIGDWSYEKFSDEKGNKILINGNCNLDVWGKKNYAVYYQGKCVKKAHKGMSKLESAIDSYINENLIHGYSNSPIGVKTLINKFGSIEAPCKFVKKTRKTTRQNPK